MTNVSRMWLCNWANLGFLRIFLSLSLFVADTIRVCDAAVAFMNIYAGVGQTLSFVLYFNVKPWECDTQLHIIATLLPVAIMLHHNVTPQLAHEDFFMSPNTRNKNEKEKPLNNSIMKTEKSVNDAGNINLIELVYIKIIWHFKCF